MTTTTDHDPVLPDWHDCAEMGCDDTGHYGHNAYGLCFRCGGCGDPECCGGCGDKCFPPMERG